MTIPFPIATRPGLLPRIACLAGLFAAETIAICAGFDNYLADGNFRHGGAAVLRFVIAAAAFLATIGYVRFRGQLEEISSRCVGTPISPGLLLAHFCAMTAFGVVSARLFRNDELSLRTDLLASSWVGLGMLAIALAAFAFAPRKLWRDAFRATDNTWVYALCAGVSASLLVRASLTFLACGRSAGHARPAPEVASMSRCRY